jgi:transcription termination/antitermination protein NusG
MIFNYQNGRLRGIFNPKLERLSDHNFVSWIAFNPFRVRQLMLRSNRKYSIFGNSDLCQFLFAPNNVILKHAAMCNVASCSTSAYANEESVAPLAWFALRVRTNVETWVTELLLHRGYECFLPVCNLGHQQPRRAPKRSGVALFPDYVFCRFDVTKRLPILMIQGVLNVVSIGKIPAPLAEVEIYSIQEALKRSLSVKACAAISGGNPVPITQGPMAGLAGLFVKAKNKQQLFITVTLLQRTVLVEVDDTDWDHA